MFLGSTMHCHFDEVTSFLVSIFLSEGC
jgi:hypothetical protein